MAAGRWISCCNCKHPIWMDAGVEEMLRQNRASWYCLWGHGQHFPAGPTEAETLRLERDRLKQNAARLEDEKRIAWNAANDQRERADRAERRTSAARGQITRLKNRAAAGVCPCCNRSFENLRRHMSAKHKGFALEETAPIGATVQ